MIGDQMIWQFEQKLGTYAWHMRQRKREVYVSTAYIALYVVSHLYAAWGEEIRENK